MITGRVSVELKGLQKFQDYMDEHLSDGPEGSTPISVALRQWSLRYRAFLQARFRDYSQGKGDWPPLAKSTIMRRRGGAKLYKKKSFVDKGKNKIDPETGVNKNRSAAGKRVAKIKALEDTLHKLKNPASRYGGIGAHIGRRRRIRETEKKIRQEKKKFRKFKVKQESQAHAAKQKLKRQQSVEKKLAGKYAILRDTGLLFGALMPTPMGAPGWIEERTQYGILVGYGGNASHGDGKATIADIASFHQSGGPNLPVRKIIVPPSELVLAAMTKDMEKAVQKLGKDFIG